MAAFGLKIDSTGENPANVSLDINDGNKWRAMKATFPTPPRKVNWGSPSGGDGSLPASLQYENRTINIEDRVVGSSAADLQTQLGLLEQKVGKINEVDGVGATLEVTTPSGVACVFDLLEASADYEIDNAAIANRMTTVTIVFTAKPFWRSGLAREVAGVDHSETTLPCVIGVDTTIGGEVPALGRLVIDDDQGQDQWSAIWGLQCQNYDPSADATLFYQAESRTPQGGAATAALAGASGTGNNTVLQASLTNSYQSMLSTQASGGGNHLRHVGNYRVLARIQRPVNQFGTVSICLEWAEGDFRRRQRNNPVVLGPFDRLGVWMDIDLGLVNLSQAASGTPRWEGRILAKSTGVGNDLYLDWLMLIPVDEGYGTSKVVPYYENPAVFSARDEFEQTAGVISGKTLPAGGTWTSVEGKSSGFGAEEDFKVNASFGFHLLERNNSKVDPGGEEGVDGRIALAGATNYAAVVASIDLWNSVRQGGETQGLIARYTNLDNCVMVVFNGTRLTLWKVVGGTGKALADTGPNAPFFEWPFNGGATPMRLRLLVDASGRCIVWVSTPGGYPQLVLAASDSDLATGGTLATGRVGIRDWKQGIPNTRYYDNFFAFTPIADAAVFAGQSLEVRGDRALREDSTGTNLVRAPNYRGSYFTVPPSRQDGRSVRTIVKLSRNNPDLPMSDPAIDDASFKIFWQTRGLVLPS